MDHLQNNERRYVDRTPIGRQTEPESGGSGFASEMDSKQHRVIEVVYRKTVILKFCLLLISVYL